jgi:hypothetical protein
MEGLGGVLLVATSGSTGRTLRTQTDIDGQFVLELPGSGIWRISATRLGFTTATATLDVDRGDLSRVVLRMAIEPLRIEGLTAAVVSACSRGTPDEFLVATFEQLRAALAPPERGSVEAFAFQVERTTLEFTNGRFPRDRQAALGGAGWAYLEVPDTVWVLGALPISESNAERARDGFITPAIQSQPDLPSWIYSPLLPGALFSTAFVETHCFSLRSRGMSSEPVVLEFRPKPGAERWFGVQGSVTIDPAATSARIAFRYAGLPFLAELREQGDFWNGRHHLDFAPVATGDRFGGETELTNIEGLGWIVSRAAWSWPKIERGQRLALRASAPRPESERSIVPANHMAPANMWLLATIRETRVELRGVRIADPGGS